MSNSYAGHEKAGLERIGEHEFTTIRVLIRIGRTM